MSKFSQASNLIFLVYFIGHISIGVRGFLEHEGAYTIGEQKFEIIEGEVYEVVPGESCYRSCQSDVRKVCVFEFAASWWRSFTNECGECPYKIEDCYSQYCIAADGIKRLVQVVNKQLPGPSIEVCFKDVIRVTLINELQHGQGTSIHWHGIQQQGTQFNDGVPYLTQCFVDYKEIFVYEFAADPPGTHFWHSHAGLQAGDGFHGALIVRKPLELDKLSDLYDFDLSEHVAVIFSWRDATEKEHYQTMMTTVDSELIDTPHTLLINGRGQYLNFEGLRTPLEVFKVEKGYRYLFRLIHVGPNDCRLIVSFDRHKMLVIAGDVGSLEPISVDAINLTPGERYNVVINADQDIASYVMRVVGEAACHDMVGTAVLYYEGAGSLETVAPTEIEKPLLLNYLNTVEKRKYEVMYFSDVRSLDDFSVEGKTGEPDEKIYMKVYMNDMAQASYEHPPMTTINDIIFKDPARPLFLTVGEGGKAHTCNPEALIDAQIDCKQEVCACNYVVNLKIGELVEIVLLVAGHNEDSGKVGNHPFHLHGHDFIVLGTGVLNEGMADISVERFKELDEAGLIERNLELSPRKDTIGLPSSGYVIIRFIAENPGWWLFHCHLDTHLMMGMQLVFQVGSDAELPQSPEGYPTCGSWPL